MDFKTILFAFLKFLIRKRDYLSRAIYIIVVEIIRELSALSFRQGLVELADEIKQNPTIQGWKYWGIRILEIILIGGDWVILSILGAILIAVSILKYKGKDFVGNKHHFNSQLRTIEGFVIAFQSTTSIKLLDQFMKDVDDSYLKNEDKNELKAQAYYLMGLCRISDDSTQNAFKNFIQSYILQPNNIKYKERACTSYYYIGQKDKALIIANEILNEDALNERASAIKLFTDTAYSLYIIQATVKSGMDFKRHYVGYLLSQVNDSDASVQQVLKEELKKKIVPEKIDLFNIDYWDQVGRFVLHMGMKEQPNLFATRKENYDSNTFIQYANKIYSVIYSTISKTEAFKNYKVFRITALNYFQTEYLLKGNDEPVFEMLKIFKEDLYDKEYSFSFALPLLIYLNQLHRYNDVLELAKFLNRDDHPIHLMRYQALIGLDKKDEAFTSLIAYLKSIDSIKGIEVDNLIGFGDFLIQEGKSVKEFYQEYIESKSFEILSHKEIVFCYYHRYIVEQLNVIETKLNSVLTGYQELTEELRYVVLIILFSVKKYDTIVSLIESYHNWQTELIPLHVYTSSLLNLRNDSTKLLNVLKFRRNNSPDEKLLLEEIRINQLVGNSTEILQITSQAKIKYPNNPNFEFYHILSLYRLKNEDGLQSSLNETLLTKTFHWQQKFILARICIEHNKKLLGLELFYQETIKDGGPILKQNYFALTTMIAHSVDEPVPQNVGVDNVVRVQANQETTLITIDDKSIKENWLAKSILGFKKGDAIKVDEPLTHKKIQVTVLDIFDKYTGLTAKIADEIGKSDFTGMSIKSVSFQTSSLESMTEALIGAFGEAGDQDKIRKEEALKQYYNGKISFSELVRSISRDRVLEVYSFLTSKESQGFQVIPVRDFNGVPIDEEKEFVIDFTSLPILMEISENQSGVLKHKFVISQFAIEFLENELNESKFLPEEGMTLSITSSGVRPSLHPPNYKEYRISKLQQILNWVNKNCETRVSKERLDIFLQYPDLIKEGDLYVNYLLDTVAISCNRILISDDRFHNTHFKSHYLTVSLEYYLKWFYKEECEKNLISILVQNHYVGLRLSNSNLKREFKKPHYVGANTFHYCLENLSFAINHDLTVFSEVLDFIKFIYAEDMPLSFKKQTSQEVLVHALKNYPNFNRLKKNLFNEINHRFFLLPLCLTEVLDDFTLAISVLTNSETLKY